MPPSTTTVRPVIWREMDADRNSAAPAMSGWERGRKTTAAKRGASKHTTNQGLLGTVIAVGVMRSGSTRPMRAL